MATKTNSYPTADQPHDGTASCPCDGCCNERIGRPRDARRNPSSRVTHTRGPYHLITRWSGVAADEAPICGAIAPAMGSTTSRVPWDVAGNPMPLCPACLAGAEAVA